MHTHLSMRHQAISQVPRITRRQPATYSIPSKRHQSTSLFPQIPLRPDPRDLKIPPLKQRLKPLLPFLFWWSIITSLAVHRLNIRQRSKEELAYTNAQISVLEGLIARVSKGEVVGEEMVQRELEMVGLRERTSLTDGTEREFEEVADVGWGKALFGRRSRLFGRKEEEESSATVEEWERVVAEATKPSPLVPPISNSVSAPERPGYARRAPSANVYI